TRDEFVNQTDRFWRCTGCVTGARVLWLRSMSDDQVQSTSMRYAYLSVLLVSTSIFFPAMSHAGSLGSHGETELSGSRMMTTDEPAPMRLASARSSNMGGGFIEFLFNGGQDARPMPRQRMEADPAASDIATQPMSPDRVILTPGKEQGEPARPGFDPR